MPLYNIPENELRDVCRRHIESLELWLRRLVHEEFLEVYGSDYLNRKAENGDSLIKEQVRDEIESRYTNEPSRFSRKIDAAQLDHLIYIICKETFYKENFRKVFSSYFLSREMLRQFFNAIVEARHRLSHANPISVRDAERVICYSNDIVDALKAFYGKKSMEDEFNVPKIIRISDSFGMTALSGTMPKVEPGFAYINLYNDDKAALRPGDKLSLEVEVDPSFDPASYEICWLVPQRGKLSGRRLVLTIEETDVMAKFQINCRVIAKRPWHKFPGYDDEVKIRYKVLPPIE